MNPCTFREKATNSCKIGSFFRYSIKRKFIRQRHKIEIFAKHLKRINSEIFELVSSSKTYKRCFTLFAYVGICFLQLQFSNLREKMRSGRI